MCPRGSPWPSLVPSPCKDEIKAGRLPGLAYTATAMSARPDAFLSRVPRVSELYRQVVKHVAHKWEELCMCLEFDPYGTKQETIRQDFIKQGVEMCCLQVLLLWIREGGGSGKTVCWGSIITCLQDMELRTVAKDLKEALNGMFDSVVVNSPTILREIVVVCTEVLSEA